MRLKTSMIVVIVLLAVCSSAFAYPNEQDGFRGMVWGTQLGPIKEQFIFSHNDDSYGGIEVYTKKNDVMEIGSAKLSKIEYAFWRGRLQSVTVVTDGYSNWAGILQATTAKFGNGYKQNRYIEKYFWGGKTTTILLKLNEVSNNARLYMSSVVIGNEMDAWERSQAGKGAATGF